MFPKFFNRYFTLLLILLLAFMAESCSRDREQAGDGGAGGRAYTGVLKGKLKISLAPDNPVAASTLRVSLLGGVGSAEYEWYLGDEQIPETGPVLDPGPFKKGDTVEVFIRADDKEGTAFFEIGNTPPTVKSITIEPTHIFAGTDVRASAIGDDVDGDSLTFKYRWFINDMEVGVLGGDTLLGTSLYSGDELRLEVTPNDGVDDGPPYKTVSVTIPNAPPAFISDSVSSFEGDEYIYKVKVEDPDGDDVTVTLVDGPSGMTIDRGGTVRWKVGQDDAGLHNVKILADDGKDGKTYQEYSIDITINK